MDTKESIGKKVRGLRKSKNITLKKLAKDTGLSYSFLSNLENGKHSITISNLSKLANYFNIDMVDFFSHEHIEDQPVVIREAEENFITEDNVLMKVISPNRCKLFNVMHAEISKDSNYDVEYHSHEKGEELLYIIKGEVKVTVEDKDYIVKKGDSIFYKCELQHKFKALKRPVEILIVLSHFH